MRGEGRAQSQTGQHDARDARKAPQLISRRRDIVDPVVGREGVAVATGIARAGIVEAQGCVACGLQALCEHAIGAVRTHGFFAERVAQQDRDGCRTQARREPRRDQKIAIVGAQELEPHGSPPVTVV